MEFVVVGDPSNEADTYTGYGNVDLTYEIGKYDVTANEYCEFLNAVAADDPHGLYNEQMALDQNIACIQRHGSPGNYSYSIIDDNENRGQFPITYVNWYSAARFCNWMQNGCPSGHQDLTTTEAGTYFFSDDANDVLWANHQAIYSLPTEDQWYKAAYYNSHRVDSPLYWLYPTKSNFPPGNTMGTLHNEANYRYGFWYYSFAKKKPPYLTPVGAFSGSPGPYGTYDMGGNVFQWTCTQKNPNNSSSSFITRGGSWLAESGLSLFRDPLQTTSRSSFDPATSNNQIGFRLVRNF